MPLFGHHKDKHTTTHAPATGTGTGVGTGVGGAGSGPMPVAPGAHRPYESTNLNTTNVIPGSGTHNQHDGPDLTGGQGHHLGPQTGYHNDTYPEQGQYGNDGYGTGVPGASAGSAHGHHGYMHGTSVGGPGMGAGAGELPSANVVNRSPQGGQHGTGGAGMTGKIERAVGNIVGSRSLQEKGLQKEQEAKAYKIQAAELSEAERLEKEALMRRERAVAHGAHPDNRHGGANPSAGPF